MANTIPTPAAMNAAQLAAENARLAAELAALRAMNDHANGLTLKVSEKKGVSVYGLQRMPVTLYCQQWERLFAKIPDIKAFIEAHKAELSVK